MIDIIHRDEKCADCDLVEAALVKREKNLKAKLQTTTEQLRVAKVAQLTANVKLKAKEMQVEEGKKALRRLEMMLRMAWHKNEMTVNQMDDKANELMTQITELHQREHHEVAKWRELEHRVDALEDKHRVLLGGDGVQAE
ncbi:hypothetical protein S83_001830 [Arachis hypogaea]